MGLTRKKRYEAALDAIGEALNALLGLRLDALHTLSAADLFRRLTLTETAMVGREQCLFVAALLKESGDIYTARGQFEEGLVFYLKALQFTLELYLNDDVAAKPDYAPDVDALLSRFDVTTLPMETQISSILYYEQVGAYSKAEDLLFDMLDTNAGDAETMASLIEIGTAFYERLQRQSDAALVAGHLSRDEVARGLREVQSY